MLDYYSLLFCVVVCVSDPSCRGILHIQHMYVPQAQVMDGSDQSADRTSENESANENEGANRQKGDGETVGEEKAERRNDWSEESEKKRKMD